MEENKEVVVNEKKEQQSSGASMGYAIASLACGVLGLYNLLAPFASVAFGIVAIILCKKSFNTKWHKMAIAGQFTGYFSLILGSIMCVLIIIYFIFCMLIGMLDGLISVLGILFV